MKIEWRKDIRGLGSALLFAVCVAFLFQSVELALLITACLGVHELGHIFFLYKSGVDWEVRFGIAGAQVITPLRDRLALGHFKNSMIHLAGPLFSLLYALLALGIHIVAQPPTDYWLRLSNFSAMTCLLNTLPIGGLSDGGKFVKKLFASLQERSEKTFLWALAAGSLSLLWIIFVTQGELIRLASTILIGLWFYTHILVESWRDDPADAQSPQAMTTFQAAVLFSGLAGLLLVSTAIVMLTPLWLTREHVLNMVSGQLTLLVYIILQSPVAVRVLIVIVGLLAVVQLGRLVFKRLKASRLDSEPTDPALTSDRGKN
jgi:hypothetical protein